MDPELRHLEISFCDLLSSEKRSTNKTWLSNLTEQMGKVVGTLGLFGHWCEREGLFL